jgi:membrane protease YdiL (CAAX protease family)
MTTYLEYARRGRTAWWRWLLTIVLAVAAGLALDVAIGVTLTVMHLMPADMAVELQRPTHPVVFFTAAGLSFGTILAALVLAARLLQGKTAGDIIGAWRWSRFATGFGVWAACLVVMTLADVLIHPSGFRWSATSGTLSLAVTALLGLAVQSFAEEFVFRGYITQGLLLATKRPVVAAVLSGVLFGVMHIPNGMPQFVNATLFGVVSALIAIRTGGIAFTYGVHLINNLFGAVVVVSAGDVFNGSPGLFTQSTPHLMWWDVGLGVALLAVPVWVVLRQTRKPEPAPF